MFLGSAVSHSRDDISNMFATHFSAALSDQTPTLEQIESSLTFVPRDVFDLSDPQFTSLDISNGICNLKCSTAPGPDGIPSIVFRKCASSLVEPLKVICNKSVASSLFPEQWKMSTMFPAYKKGNKRDISNYRGVTSLCAGSKLIEILIGNILFQSSKQYITNEQHGFYPHRSTATNLTQFTSTCITHMEKGLQIDSVYTDLKAAFDRVNHDILLAKVARLGASPGFVRWLESYLRNRIMMVKLGNTLSRSLHCPSGVPRGSNLGPLLFAIYFNDVCFALPQKCILLYADDLKIFLIIRSNEDCLELQRLIDMFAKWCYMNFLSISVSKCCVITFTRCKSPVIWSYTIGENSLERVSVIKDLGVPSFIDHYLHAAKKAN